MKTPLLISACLLGHNVRYDGQAKPFSLSSLSDHFQFYPFCPECAGGLPVPRPAAEQQADGSVKTQAGVDVTNAFTRGAQLALTTCQQHQIQFALLKQNSPSCGTLQVYDGSFSRVKRHGMGVCAELLNQAGIAVFGEDQISQLIVAANKV